MDSLSLIVKDLQTVTASPGTADKVTSQLFILHSVRKGTSATKQLHWSDFLLYLGEKTLDSQNTFSIHVGEKSMFLYI